MNSLNEQFKGYYHVIVISQTASEMNGWVVGDD
jgi:hypothetical protein